MDLLLYLGGGAAALVAISTVLRVFWRTSRRIVHIADLVTELSPNHGRSLKDQVTSISVDVGEIKTSVGDLKTTVDDLNTQFEDHLRDYHGG